MTKVEQYLERIATALEDISSYLKNKELIAIEKQKYQIYKNNLEEIKNLKSGDIEEKSNINNISLEDFLKSKNITIKSIRPEDEADEILDKIALFMGDRFSKIKKVYELIKKNMNTGNSFRLDMKNYQQEEIASITQLCHNLYDIAFLEQYTYYKSPKYVLYGKVNRIPKALNFFSGGWLERYIKTAIIENIKEYPINYSYLKNPQIQLPNGDDFELDILFNIEGEIYWLEAKTGEYQRYVQKYSNMSKILNLDYEHSFMILSDISESGANALKSMFKMTVVRIDDFSQYFKRAINHLLKIDNE